MTFLRPQLPLTMFYLRLLPIKVLRHGLEDRPTTYLMKRPPGQLEAGWNFMARDILLICAYRLSYIHACKVTYVRTRY